MHEIFATGRKATLNQSINVFVQANASPDDHINLLAGFDLASVMLCSIAGIFFIDNIVYTI